MGRVYPAQAVGQWAKKEPIETRGQNRLMGKSRQKLMTYSLALKPMASEKTEKEWILKDIMYAGVGKLQKVLGLEISIARIQMCSWKDTIIVPFYCAGHSTTVSF